MTAERTPQAKVSVFARGMGAMTRLVVRFPAATLAVGLALGCAALVLSGTRLGFHTSRLDLLNPQSDYNRLITEILEIHGTEIALLTQRLDRSPSPPASLRACGFPNQRPPDAPAD